VKLLHILHLEDSPVDAELVTACLAEAGIDTEVVRVETRAAFVAALERERFDLLFADYALPSFDGIAALQLARETCPEVPFIFISGALGEELAIETLKGGATDYVLKQRLERLVPAVQRALSVAEGRAERQRAEEALRASEARLAGIIGSAMDAIITIDVEQRITVFNAAAEQIFCCPAADALGQPIDRFIPERFRTLHGEHVRAFGRTRTTSRSMTSPGTLVARRATGEEFPVEAAISQVEAAGQKLYTVILRDITQRKQLEGELRQQAVELAEADRRKDEFLAMLAHELRNPLTPIWNALELMRRRASDAEAVERTRSVVERQVHHLSRLIDDLLDVSRITRGKIWLRYEWVDLARLVQQLIEDARGGMEAAGLTLTLELPQAPVSVWGDPTRLAQAVGNLLQNAAKFTDRGGQVNVCLTSDPAGHQAAVTIRDTGIGIAPEVLPYLFQPFVQADRTLDRSRGGLGLGLALVRGLVEMHGGEVHAQSAGPGGGAEFTLLLPLAQAPVEPRELPASAGLVPRPCRVLVVEDNLDAAETLRDLLELSGHEVAVAYSGTAGVDTARQFWPEVVLCDLGLPGMDGYAVAAELRRDPVTAAARLIAVTGYGQEEDRRHCREAGFDLCLTKPVDPTELERLLAADLPPPAGPVRRPPGQ
jgi:PAS domain S-box-containing protein